MKTTEELTYSEALAELEHILAQLRGDECDIDALVKNTKRAVELLNYCKGRLTSTEEELKEVLKSLK